MVVLSSFGFRNERKTLVSSANSRKESFVEELSLFEELTISFLRSLKTLEIFGVFESKNLFLASHFYCFPVWGNSVKSNIHNSELQLVQNFAARVVFW